MNTAIAGQTHQVNALAVQLSVLVGIHNLRILQDAAVGTGTVNLHQVLIYDTTGTDIQVTYLRVTHLSVGQPHVLAASQQLTVGIVLLQIIHIRSRCIEDNITLTFITDAPAVQDHQKRFLSHNNLYLFYVVSFSGCKITNK